ncbi:hypothetical protein MMC10_010645 [Thelotrema lepadinum]|nr:hypothetical protein [Thelotrema lepadinum]
MEKESMLEAQKSLLSGEEEYTPNWKSGRRPTRNGSQLTSLNIALLAVNLLGILANLIFPSLWRSGAMEEPERGLIYSPAREAVAYEKVFSNVTLGEENEFMGEPRPEQSKAWKDAYGNCEDSPTS